MANSHANQSSVLIVTAITVIYIQHVITEMSQANINFLGRDNFDALINSMLSLASQFVPRNSPV